MVRLAQLVLAIALLTGPAHAADKDRPRMLGVNSPHSQSQSFSSVEEHW